MKEEKPVYQRVNELLGTNYEKELNNCEWDAISKQKKLSEDFIYEFKDKVNWASISMFQVLSEDFI